MLFNHDSALEFSQAHLGLYAPVHANTADVFYFLTLPAVQASFTRVNHDIASCCFLVRKR